MESIKINTAQNIDIEYEIAGLGDRIVARLIDLGIFLILAIILIVLIIIVSLRRAEVLLITIWVIYIGIIVFYDLVCELKMNGQSIGKRIMKIKVISLDGNQPSISQYLLRWLFRIVDFTFSGQLLALICVAVSEKKQRVGDLVAGTTLIKTVPRTQLGNVAFTAIQPDNYQVTFNEVLHLNDRDVELIHEVLIGYYESGNADLIYAMAKKIKDLLTVHIPQGMNELQFLETINKDYSFLTSNMDV